MNQFGYPEFNMEIAVEDEAAIMEMMLTDPAMGLYDCTDLIEVSRQHHEQINLKRAETPTWLGCPPRNNQQPMEELASFPPYRPIDFTASATATALPPRTSFPPSPTGPKFSYIPAPEPPPSSRRLPAVTESSEGTLISMVSSGVGTTSSRQKAPLAPGEDRERKEI